MIKEYLVFKWRIQERTWNGNNELRGKFGNWHATGCALRTSNKLAGQRPFLSEFDSFEQTRFPASHCFCKSLLRSRLSLYLPLLRLKLHCSAIINLKFPSELNVYEEFVSNFPLILDVCTSSFLELNAWKWTGKNFKRFDWLRRSWFLFCFSTSQWSLYRHPAIIRYWVDLFGVDFSYIKLFLQWITALFIFFFPSVWLRRQLKKKKENSLDFFILCFVFQRHN